MAGRTAQCVNYPFYLSRGTIRLKKQYVETTIRLSAPGFPVPVRPQPMEPIMTDHDGRKRVIIEAVAPSIEHGAYPIKRVPGESVTVTADIFADGHDEISASVMYRYTSSRDWHEVPMTLLDNDRWHATFTITETTDCHFTVCGRVDAFSSWKKGLLKKYEAGQDVTSDLLAGAALLRKTAASVKKATASKLHGYADIIGNTGAISDAVATASQSSLLQLMRETVDRTLDTVSPVQEIAVERKRALYSNWYELFPRSCSADPEGHGTFQECEKQLTAAAGMGFHIVYFPPIHPIGKKHRKGKNNSVVAKPGDPGSPWAIGSDEGGHKAVNPSLGTLDDFDRLVKHAASLGLEIALDLAYQCSPDHPYITEHPQWFRKRPDGSIQYAENPPKKYEDIVPFDFECDDWKNLWNELKSVVDFWIEHGITVFRVDNPHTKAFSFWRWLIAEIKKQHPEVLFLAEAFTRPKVMQYLAKIGFSQSYTYYTWRNTKWELTEYINELTTTGLREYFRPNFWPNTPDILPEFLQYGGRPAFVLRLMLAGTLCSNYGIYGPAYELCVREALPDREEYINSEKYEIKQWERDSPAGLRDLITRLNRIRENNAALQTMWNTTFFTTDNDSIIAFAKATPDLSNVIFVIANLDPFHTQSGWVDVPYEKFDIPEHQSYLVDDLLTDDKYVWNGNRNFVRLTPHILPVHIFRVHRKLKRENDFDYYY